VRIETGLGLWASLLLWVAPAWVWSVGIET